LADLLENEGFQTGALASAGGVVVVALVALLVGGGPRRNPWAGLVFAGATLVGLDHQDMLPDDLVTALAVLAVGALVGEVLSRTVVDGTLSLAIQAVVVAPGAWLVAKAAEVDDPTWVTPALLVVIIAGSALAADFDRWVAADGGWTTGLSPVLLAVTVGGVWVTVPETQHAVVLAGAAVPVALLGWPRPFASLGVTGSALAVALVAWTSAVDGVGRHGAIVGGLACLGMFLLGPALRRYFGVRPDWPTLLVAHVVLVGLCSRVAGLRSDAATALVLAAAAYIGIGALTCAWSRRQRI
jgi:hypothetical protein